MRGRLGRSGTLAGALLLLAAPGATPQMQEGGGRPLGRILRPLDRTLRTTLLRKVNANHPDRWLASRGMPDAERARFPDKVLQGLAMWRPAAIGVVRARKELAGPFQDRLLELLSRTAVFGKLLDRVRRSGDPRAWEESLPLLMLVAGWQYDVLEVGRSKQGGDPGAYRLPNPHHMKAYAEAASEEPTPLAELRALRKLALRFLEETGALAAYLEDSVYAGLDAARARDAAAALLPQAPRPDDELVGWLDARARELRGRARALDPGSHPRAYADHHARWADAGRGPPPRPVGLDATLIELVGAPPETRPPRRLIDPQLLTRVRGVLEQNQRRLEGNPALRNLGSLVDQVKGQHGVAATKEPEVAEEGRPPGSPAPEGPLVGTGAEKGLSGLHRESSNWSKDPAARVLAPDDGRGDHAGPPRPMPPVRPPGPVARPGPPVAPPPTGPVADPIPARDPLPAAPRRRFTAREGGLVGLLLLVAGVAAWAYRKHRATQAEMARLRQSQAPGIGLAPGDGGVDESTGLAAVARDSGFSGEAGTAASKEPAATRVSEPGAAAETQVSAPGDSPATRVSEPGKGGDADTQVSTPGGGAPAATVAGPKGGVESAGEEGGLPGWLRSVLQVALGARYTDWSALGAGGMGTVVKAWDTRLDRPVAVKVPPPHLSSHAEFRERFLREARALARLAHENIGGVYDVPDVPEGEVPVMILEYLEGVDLGAWLHRNGVPELRSAFAWVLQAGKGLQHAHDQAILHRDIKPGNLMLVGEGADAKVKILDFGLAALGDAPSLTRSGMLMGSIPYMPPEQLRGERVGPEADQYALAVTAFQLFTGRLAFGEEDSRRMNPPSISQVKAGVPPAFDPVLARAMDPDAGARYGSVREFLEALASAARGEGAAG